MSIHLSTEEEAMIRERVASGRYPDVETALRAAVRLFVESDRDREWLERELQIGIDQANRGEMINLDSELIERIMAHARQEAGKAHRYKDAILP